MRATVSKKVRENRKTRLSELRTPIKELLVDKDMVLELKKEAEELLSHHLTSRQICDLELLLSGAFSPLSGFMVKKDYTLVCERMRLGDRSLWPIPVTLDLSEKFAKSIKPGQKIALRHPEGVVIAVMTVTDLWKANKKREVEQVFGTTDDAHPGVFRLIHQAESIYAGGTVEGIVLPPHHIFTHLRHTPNQLRQEFRKRKWKRIVAFQTRNPMHRAHIELTTRAMQESNAALLIHPVVGPTKPGDVDPFIRVRAYEAVLPRYPKNRVKLSVLPLTMRMAGPREALLHAIVRKNYGCSHFIVGRDHAGVKNGKNGNGFYHSHEAQKLTKKYESEIGIKIVPYCEMVYVEDKDKYLPLDEVPRGTKFLSVSGTKLRGMVMKGKTIPKWITYPEVVEVLEKAYPPRHKQGFTIFFTGLSGSGKSTIAHTLGKKLNHILFQNGVERRVTNLDGDVVRLNLSKGLGFSEEDRATNVKRVGFVAQEITKHGGAAICAMIAPNSTVRREVREMIEPHGGFIQVYVATPLAVCEERDDKGFYAKARAGKIRNFTGIDSPYETPENSEIVIDTSETDQEEAANQIVGYLVSEGYIKLA